jgi:histidinol-phosphatase (PHP family)
MYIIDYHTHPYAHGEEEVKPIHNIMLLKKFIKKAEDMGINELGFTDHDRFLSEFNWENLHEIKKNSKISVKLGVEMDYYPDKEIEIKERLKNLQLDYVIGSVHYIGDWGFDHPDYIDEYKKWDIINLYKTYFELVKKSALSGLFDIIGHFDLIKIFAYKPAERDILKLTEPALEAIKKMGLAMEINTNGLNKVINEIYPSEQIIKKALEYGIPFTLGSDAHNYKRVGEGLYKAALLLKKLSCNRIATFNNREMIYVNL